MVRQLGRVLTFTVATVAMSLSGTAPSWTDSLTTQARLPATPQVEHPADASD